MISYRQWQTLNESLGGHNLGLAQRQVIGGIHSPYHTTSPETNAEVNRLAEKAFGAHTGMDSMERPEMPPMPMKKKKRPHPEMDMDSPEGEEGMDGEEDMDMENPEDAEEGDEDADSGFGDEEMGDEESGEEGLDGEEGEEGMDMPKPKKKLFGNPHDNSAFMRRMKKEAKEVEVEVPDEDDDSCDCKCGGEDDGEKVITDDKPEFLMKKKMKGGKKKCCKKCKKMKAEVYNPYRRPVPVEDTDEAFAKSIASHFGHVNQKFNDGLDGMREDLLLSPTDNLEPVAGQVGYAPQGRIGAPLGSAEPVAETVSGLMKRIANLEKQIKENK